MVVAAKSGYIQAMDGAQHPSPWQSSAIFEAATHTAVGDGETALFWTDMWLRGESIMEIAPYLSAMVPKWALSIRTIRGCSKARGFETAART